MNIMVSLICEVEIMWMNPYTKQEQTHKRRKQTRGCQGRGKVAGMVGSGERGVGIPRRKLLYGIINKILLYGTRNYIQHPVINQNGKEYTHTLSYITESLYSTAEINTL